LFEHKELALWQSNFFGWRIHHKRRCVSYWRFVWRFNLNPGIQDEEPPRKLLADELPALAIHHVFWHFPNPETNSKFGGCLFYKVGAKKQSTYRGPITYPGLPIYFVFFFHSSICIDGSSGNRGWSAPNTSEAKQIKTDQLEEVLATEFRHALALDSGDQHLREV